MTFLKHKELADVYGKMIKEGFGTTTPTYPGAISTTPAVSATPPSNTTTDDPVLGILELIKAGKIDSAKLADALKKHMEQSGGTQLPKTV